MILGVIGLAGFLASLTDWLFMDVLVRGFYKSAPEIWRPNEGGARIFWSQVIGIVATAAVILLCRMAPSHCLTVALLVWCAGAMPVMAQNFQWMRLDGAIAASHAAGWLARLVIAAGLAGLLLAH